MNNKWEGNEGLYSLIELTTEQLHVSMMTQAKRTKINANKCLSNDPILKK
jgi:hypothetical protein